MKNLLYIFLVLGFAFLGAQASKASPSSEEEVSLAKAAELSSHRIDRLVTLQKIDRGFLTRLQKIETFKVEGADPVKFRSIISQTKPLDGGQPLQVELLLAKDGKPLSFKVLNGGMVGPDPEWQLKDPVSLSENALHYVLENNHLPEVAPFYSDFQSYELSIAVLDNQKIALGTFISSTKKEKLIVKLGLDGTFLSAEVSP